MKTIQGFTEFYNKSKNRDSNKNNGRDAYNDWLSFFASKSSPRWLSAMTVANLANAMRNYQMNNKHNSKEINILLKLIDNFVMNFKTQEISNTLLSLNQIGLSLAAIEASKRGLGNNLLDSVLRNVSDFNPQGIANTLLSLNQMGLSFVDIEASKRGLVNELLDSASRNVSKFNSQDTANTLLSYTRMISDISMTETEKDTHRNTLTNLFVRATLMYVNNEFSNIELNQISEALTWSRVYGFGDYSESFSGVNLEIKTIESRLQKDVTVKLKGLVGSDNLEVEKGFGFADCLVVDCYIRPCNLVVEIDGPDHYDKDGGLNYASIQKKTLLEKFGLKVERIKYDDWDNASAIEQVNLLKDMLDKHEPTSITSKFGIFSGSSVLRADSKEFVPESRGHWQLK